MESVVQTSEQAGFWIRHSGVIRVWSSPWLFISMLKGVGGSPSHAYTSETCIRTRSNRLRSAYRIISRVTAFSGFKSDGLPSV